MVAYSGGVDSSYAAELCRNAGFDVLAVTMKLFESETAVCDFAVLAAEKAGLEHRILNLSAPFQQEIMRDSWNVYSTGETPNPCAVCNPLFKFGKLADFARENGCSAMVTGHYARIEFDPDGQVVLRRGLCREKDQSYFLFGVPSDRLAFCRMPLGGLAKSDVKANAAGLELAAASRPESQDICFGGDSMPDTLCRLFHDTPRPGNFIDETGKVLGRHRGVQFYTIGQRKGTGVAMGVPAYVKKIDADSGDITLTTDPAHLCSGQMRVRNVNWLICPPVEPMRCEIQTRYRSRTTAGIVIPEPDGFCTVRFDLPVKSVAPGQAAVFYDGDRVLGGGWIMKDSPSI